jgi:phosphoribosylformimino-5-aminoimidazole carboxamide ribotide isomerase
MIIFPAIDLYEGKAVRLFKGNYNEMTVYSDNPPEIAADFAAQGATHIHVVDLEGAKTGKTPNIDIISNIAKTYGLFTEVGGGIRSMEVIDRYIDSGVSRVILGTAAVTEEGFVEAAVKKHGKRIAVGVDIKDGYVAIRGWTEKSELLAMDFCKKMEDIGVDNIICTDISRDGAMKGTNHELYREMSERFSVKITASGGVSSIDDVKRLSSLGIYGAIIGKAYYTGAISIKEAVEVTK